MIETQTGGLCVAVGKEETVVLAACPGKDAGKDGSEATPNPDIFVFGASGRFCKGQDGCLTVDNFHADVFERVVETIPFPDAPTRALSEARLGTASN